MESGLSSAHIAKIHAIFAQFPEIEEAILYGSRAKGTYHAGSDIDLTLKGEQITSAILHRIASALDDSSLPYRFDVSLFSDIENEKLREHIARVGVLFYQRKV